MSSGGHTIDAEKVFLDRLCKCGQRIMVLQLKGREGPTGIHHNPICEEFQRMAVHVYLQWLGEADVARELAPPGAALPDGAPAPTPIRNRRVRRREAALGRKR